MINRESFVGLQGQSEAGSDGSNRRAVDSFIRFISSISKLDKPLVAETVDDVSSNTSICESETSVEHVATTAPAASTTTATTITPTAETGSSIYRTFIASITGEITTDQTNQPVPSTTTSSSQEPTIGIMNVAKVEYAFKQLQKNLKLITKQAPDLYQLKLVLDSLDTGAAMELRQNHLITIASKIKSRYKIGKLPIFDEIIAGNVKFSLADLTKLETQLENEIIPPLVVNCLENEVTTEKVTLPPLPPLQDPQIESTVFTHKSYINNNRPDPSPPPGQGKYLINGHNERLEFLGDSVLNSLVTLIIYNLFPEATEGQLSQIRSDLVNNKTLGHFSLAYGMHNRLKTLITDLKIAPDQKLFADVFEAYIGGLALERDLIELDDIRAWLEQLYTPMLDNIRSTYIKPPIDREAKTQLYSMIGRNEVHPQYRTVQQGNPVTGKDFIINCTMDGELLGIGSGNSIKEASLRAAMDALAHESQLEKHYLARQEIELPIRKRRNELKELKREEKIKQFKLQQQKQEEEAEEFGELPPPSPIRTSYFPLEPDYTIPLDNEAKNELYASIGKTARTQPTYIVSKTGDNKHIATLKIRGITITSASDSSKKKAMSRAARTLLNHKEAMYEISKSF
ncbi:Ribonuclease 3 [Spathaspora sp. JA1]|nr:Ribonuclease 3 [Spathaspora sp. JA1]